MGCSRAQSCGEPSLPTSGRSRPLLPLCRLASGPLTPHSPRQPPQSCAPEAGDLVHVSTALSLAPTTRPGIQSVLQRAPLRSSGKQCTTDRVGLCEVTPLLCGQRARGLGWDSQTETAASTSRARSGWRAGGQVSGGTGCFSTRWLPWQRTTRVILLSHLPDGGRGMPHSSPRPSPSGMPPVTSLPPQVG